MTNSAPKTPEEIKKYLQKNKGRLLNDSKQLEAAIRANKKDKS
ncbi:hypothetical protein [Endozoicomonas numazuensis]|nr:hypothetical protein [Endozoicomonas numazuensis]